VLTSFDVESAVNGNGVFATIVMRLDAFQQVPEHCLGREEEKRIVASLTSRLHN